MLILQSQVYYYNRSITRWSWIWRRVGFCFSALESARSQNASNRPAVVFKLLVEGYCGGKIWRQKFAPYVGPWKARPTHVHIYFYNKATINKKRSKHRLLCRLLRPCSLYLCTEKAENIISWILMSESLEMLMISQNSKYTWWDHSPSLLHISISELFIILTLVLQSQVLNYYCNRSSI